MLELLYVSVLINLMLFVYAFNIKQKLTRVLAERRTLKTKLQLDSLEDQVKQRFDCECG
jgi:hypothetical protein